MTLHNVIVQKHADGYVTYPLGIAGVVVGQGDTDDEALADVTSAIRFHVETFEPEVLTVNSAFAVEAAPFRCSPGGTL